MGPNASVTQIVEKLNIIFATVASYDALMGNFYKLDQDEVETVCTFANKIDDLLSEVRQMFSNDLTQAQAKLKECLFHEIRKIIRDSISLHYDNSKVTYMNHLVTSRKAEAEGKRHQYKGCVSLSTSTAKNGSEDRCSCGNIIS